MEKLEDKVLQHNPKDYKIRWGVSIVPIVFFFAILVTGIAVPDLFKSVIDKGVMLVMKDMGWFISLSTLFFVGFCFLVALLPIGNIRLGGPNAKPELKTFEYFALSLCAGMATGFILWPTAEMVEYTARPPQVFGLEPGSYQAIIDALNFEWLHWAFTPYALYTAFGIVVTYAYYNLKKPYAASSAFYPLCGERLGERGKTVVDAVCLFSIIGGVAGSMGYGLLQLGSGLEYLFNIKTGLASWIGISIVITIIYTATSVSGLKKGIAWLSEKNTYLFIFFLIFVVVFGPKSFMFNLTSEAFGQFIRDYIPMLTVQGFMPESDLWPQWWNNIWWLDWIAFAPMTGLFMATLSKGRTLREFVVVNMILPSFFAMFWFGMFGGFAAHTQFVMGEDLLSVLEAHGHDYMQIFTMSYLPFDAITKPLLLITQLISFITLANSMTSTVSMMTIQPGKEYLSEEAPMKIKIFWGVMMASIAVLFLSSGGLDGAKSVKAITGFPVFFMELLVVIGFIRFFVKGMAPEKNIHMIHYDYGNLDSDTGELTEYIMPAVEKTVQNAGKAAE
ncbi:MAG: BCCT family transporter [Eubacteriales bacterium]